MALSARDAKRGKNVCQSDCRNPGIHANDQPSEGIDRFRPVRLARLHPPQPDYHRRARAPDRRRRPARHDLQSLDLRESHRRQHRLFRQTLEELAKRKDLDAKGIYEQLAIRDIQDAADVLRPVYDQTKRRDGYVSLEVSPYLAHKTQETIDEARRLWKAVGRDNVMIKVPGTPEGIPAIRELISDGINVNVTLLFAQDVYEKVAEAYIAGLKTLAKSGGDFSRVASVASFFVSRIDTLIDSSSTRESRKREESVRSGRCAQPAGQSRDRQRQARLSAYKKIFSGPRWQALAARGAQTQRVLWASTGTKNPAYRDVLYVEELIGPDTVNTIPPATFDAFRDHGHPRASLEENVDAARKTMDDLARAGISMQGGHRPAHRRRREALRRRVRQAARRRRQARAKACARAPRRISPIACRTLSRKP